MRLAKQWAAVSLAAAIFFWPAAAAAQMSDRELGIGAGIAFPGDDLDDAVNSGLDLQAQYLQRLHPNLDAGGQLDLVLFGEDERFVGGGANRTFRQTNVSAVTAQAVVRVHPGLSGSVKPYGILGIGLGLSGIDVEVDGPVGASRDDRELGFTLSLGGGVDVETANGQAVGVSLRLQSLDVDGVDDATFVALMGHWRLPAR